MDTTVDALKVGAQLVMGKYGVDKDNPYPIVWLKGNPNCDFITEKAIDYLCFDAAEETGYYRRVNNAKYPVSNLFSFLNSDQMMWYHAMHDNDSSPGAFVRYSYARYEDHYGFLYFFEDHEIASLVRKEYVVGENRVSSLIRLPSIADIFSLQDGRRFDLFKRKGIRPNPTADLFDLKARYAGLDSDRGFMSFWLLSEHFSSKIGVEALIGKLVRFNNDTAELRAKERSELYETFYIPKKSGGLRRIDAPKAELMDALRRLKTIFEDDFHALYHTAAFAYVKKRSTVDAVKRHQKNSSKWFAKLDLHDFFGSTTLDYAISMFSMVFPFSEIVKEPQGEAALRTAMSLAFLNGGLPQGTPISPLITNVMMIPVDFKLSNTLRNFEKQSFIYTRYADDFIISSKYDFDVRSVEELVVSTLNSFGAPFTINASKTRYGSSAGRNWNLGVMLNKDNEITVGHKKKKQFQSMLYNYITDKNNGVAWERNDVQVMYGLHSYYRMVEKETIDAIVAYINKKMNVDVIRMMKDDLR